MNKINRTAKSFFILEINLHQVFMTSLTSKARNRNILPCIKGAYELFGFDFWHFKKVPTDSALDC